MKFLVISDLHGEIQMLEKIDDEFKKCDAVLCAGDFAKFNQTETSLPMLKALCKKHDNIFAVIGNCDEPSFRSEIESADISCEGVVVWHEGLTFCGSGGGSVFTGETPNERTDEELVSDFDVITKSDTMSDVDGKNCEWNNLIAIMHNPPKDTDCDKIANGIHVGSPALRTFIEKVKPLAVVTGHIHESAAVCKVGETTVVNPGSLADGKFALLEVEKIGDLWQVVSCELQNV